MKCPLADREGLTAYLRFPTEHHHRIRYPALIERTFGETRRRTKVIGRLPARPRASPWSGPSWESMHGGSRKWLPERHRNHGNPKHRRSAGHPPDPRPRVRPGHPGWAVAGTSARRPGASVADCGSCGADARAHGADGPGLAGGCGRFTPRCSNSRPTSPGSLGGWTIRPRSSGGGPLLIRQGGWPDAVSGRRYAISTANLQRSSVSAAVRPLGPLITWMGANQELRNGQA